MEGPIFMGLGVLDPLAVSGEKLGGSALVTSWIPQSIKNFVDCVRGGS